MKRSVYRLVHSLHCVSPWLSRCHIVEAVGFSIHQAAWSQLVHSATPGVPAGHQIAELLYLPSLAMFIPNAPSMLGTVTAAAVEYPAEFCFALTATALAVPTYRTLRASASALSLGVQLRLGGPYAASSSPCKPRACLTRRDLEDQQDLRHQVSPRSLHKIYGH